MTADPSEPAADPVIGTQFAIHRRFFDFVAARVGSREDAEEILQDAFVRGMQKADEGRDDETTVAWFYRLLRNAVTIHRRTAAPPHRRQPKGAGGARP